MLPNFLVIGVIKGATTSLYHYLNAHPEIYMAPIKEARYFTYIDAKTEGNNFPVKNQEEYESLFTGVTTEKAVGEATPGYFHTSSTAKRIYEHIPSAKLILSLRNPVDRTYSDYLMRFRLGREQRPLIEALKPGEPIVNCSMYQESLLRFMDLFGRDQIKVILYDDIIINIRDVLRDLYLFLNVDPDFQPGLGIKYNVGGIARNRLITTLSANKFIRTIRPYVPSRFLRAIKHTTLKKAPPLPDEIRNSLKSTFRNDILKTQAIINRDLSHWLS
ncbi:MAG: sulfotransferase [Gammaproteobacteria bacterium]